MQPRVVAIIMDRQLPSASSSLLPVGHPPSPFRSGPGRRLRSPGSTGGVGGRVRAASDERPAVTGGTHDFFHGGRYGETALQAGSGRRGR